MRPTKKSLLPYYKEIDLSSREDEMAPFVVDKQAFSQREWILLSRK